MDTAKVKLVTIIAPAELSHRVQDDLRELGASGYTLLKVEGRGRHGPRVRGIFDEGNVQLEALVPPEVATKLLERVAGYQDFGELVVVAYACDAEAVPRKHFV